LDFDDLPISPSNSQRGVPGTHNAGRMFAVVKRLLRHALYELRGGFLVRPLAMALIIGSFGIAVPFVEVQFHALDEWVVRLPVLVVHDAATAQGILAAIIGAIMTVVAIVLSVLLVALTLASMQFSPRILTGFVEDITNQRTIGLFLGTFLYCLAVYPSARPGLPAIVPVVAVLGALGLAVACSAGLVAFVFHIARSINVNFITERIAAETERVIDDVMPEPLRGPAPLEVQAVPVFDGGPTVLAPVSGYIRFVDLEGLRAQATKHGVALYIERRVGQFIPEGTPLFRFSKAKEGALAASGDFLERFDIGPVRTMEQDIEFGLLQLVDIALKAISPAVNDPSTAINCIDQLSRLLVRVAGREPRPAALYHPPGVVRVAFPRLSFSKLVDDAFGQIVHYGKTDAAVTLRVMRALGDVASATRDPAQLQAVGACAEKIVKVCAGHLPESAAESFAGRLARVQRLARKDGNQAVG
jgi:uncharacterized membrane protein